MGDDEPSAKEEFSYLGRVVVRTLLRDVIIVAVCAGIGALLGMLIGFGAKLGALVGVVIGLIGNPLSPRALDFGKPPRKPDDGAD